MRSVERRRRLPALPQARIEARTRHAEASRRSSVSRSRIQVQVLPHSIAPYDPLHPGLPHILRATGATLVHIRHPKRRVIFELLRPFEPRRPLGPQNLLTLTRCPHGPRARRHQPAPVPRPHQGPSARHARARVPAPGNRPSGAWRRRTDDGGDGRARRSSRGHLSLPGVRRRLARPCVRVHVAAGGRIARGRGARA